MSSPTGPIGAAAPPLGETPDFNNPRDAGHVLHLVYMCFIQTIVVVFFAIRVYVKLWANGKFRLEDCRFGAQTFFSSSGFGLTRWNRELSSWMGEPSVTTAPDLWHRILT